MKKKYNLSKTETIIPEFKKGKILKIARYLLRKFKRKRLKERREFEEAIERLGGVNQEMDEKSVLFGRMIQNNLIEEQLHGILEVLDLNKSDNSNSFFYSKEKDIENIKDLLKAVKRETLKVNKRISALNSRPENDFNYFIGNHGKLQKYLFNERKMIKMFLVEYISANKIQPKTKEYESVFIDMFNQVCALRRNAPFKNIDELKKAYDNEMQALKKRNSSS